MAPQAGAPQSVSIARRDLFVASFTLLFFELACIRWFGSMVIFLTFFTNLVLLASFLGMSLGCLAVRQRRDYLSWTMPIALLSMFLGWMTLAMFQRWSNLSIEIGSQVSPQQIFFGTEYRAHDPSKVAIPIEVIAGTFFVLIALSFVGLGQRLGRALDAVPDRLAAYSIDIAGSVSGIVMFGLCAYFQTPPLLWFAISVVGILWLMRHNLRGFRRMSAVTASAGVLILAWFTALPKAGEENFWSPYYKINLVQQQGLISTNNIGHQEMVPVSERGSAYLLPHLLQRDAGAKPFQDVLIIGAGSGNDVQASRVFEARLIDGVEIDPVIRRIGHNYHPDRPYDDPRVTIYQDDGRSFLKRTNRKYDLVIYALVDSLVLHSGYASLRLESYLFTQEAMQDVKSVLKSDGVFAMYNYYRQGWVVSRLQQMSRQTFGRTPLVFSLPYREELKIDDPSNTELFTVILAGNVGPIEERLQQQKYFWLNSKPSRNIPLNGYGSQAPAGNGWQRIGIASVEQAGTANAPSKYLPSDDWPFLYLREPLIPNLNLRGVALIAVLALGLWYALGLRRENQSEAGGRFNWQMFFLGAAFMLLETKSIVHMALLYGSTWYVNSIVFGAVLSMILAANLFVHWFKPRSMPLFYVMLIASLLVGILVPMNLFLALPGVWKTVASCAVTFAPIFFAGVIFGSAFRDSRQPGIDFGCNIAGVLLGGLCENLSLMMGFSNLLGVAIVFYILSWLLRPRLAAPSKVMPTPELVGAET
jgi:spermidine synthase